MNHLLLENESLFRENESFIYGKMNHLFREMNHLNGIIHFRSMHKNTLSELAIMPDVDPTISKFFINFLKFFF